MNTLNIAERTKGYFFIKLFSFMLYVEIVYRHTIYLYLVRNDRSVLM